MDKIIPFNKGIQRTPSLGSDGELSECVNLIPQNGELVNVKGFAAISNRDIEGELICIHRVADKQRYITLYGNKVIVYDESLEEEQEIVVSSGRNDGKVSSLAFGNIVAISGFGDEYVYMMYVGDKYTMFTMTDLKITSRVVPVILEDMGTHYKVKGDSLDNVYVQWPDSWEAGTYGENTLEKNEPTNWFFNYYNHVDYQELDGTDWDKINDVLDGAGSLSFAGSAFGVIGLKLFDDSYLYFSDIFSIDSLRLIDTTSKGEAPLYWSCGFHLLVIEHYIPDDLRALVKSVDVYTTKSTALNDDLGWENGKTSRDASKEMLELDFRLTLSFDLSNKDNYPKDTKIAQFLQRSTNDSAPILPIKEGDAKSVVGELFGYNSRVFVFAGREYLPVHTGGHTNDVFRLDYTHKSVTYKVDGTEHETYSETSVPGPYGEALDSYRLNDSGKIEYAEQLVEATIYVTVEDDDGFDKELSWTGQIQYPLPPVFSVPTVRAKRMRVYLDLSDVYLLSEENKSLGEYEKSVYGVFVHELYASERYGLSAFVNMTGKYDYYGSPKEGASFWNSNRGAGICYIQPYQMEMHWNHPNSNGDGSIVYYGYRKDWSGNKVVGSEGWSFITKNSYNQLARKSKSELYLRSNQVSYGDAENPFKLNSLNTIEVGTDAVLSLSSNAKAVSDGQFGQFPIYAFCADGIYTLEVADDGSISRVHPTTRDVCNNTASITQIDGAVVFTTSQGLKMISGSESVLLSGVMDGHNTDESAFFPSGFFAKYDEGSYDGLVVRESRDFREILRTCSILYDYAGQLLRIFPERADGVPYRYYVYSLVTHAFSSVVGEEFNGSDVGVRAVVADYPSSIVQIGENLYRPIESDRSGLHKGLLLTRPLLFDEPFALKKLQAMRLQYSKFDGASVCKMVVYVSNDGIRWNVLRSLRGGAYKYFRIGVITSLTDADALTGAVVRYDLVRTNKLR